MDSPVLAYGSGATTHITTRGWFCKEGKASLSNAVRTIVHFSKAHGFDGIHDAHVDDRDAKNKTRKVINDGKSYALNAVAKLKNNLDLRKTSLTASIESGKTSILGKIANIFRNWQLSFYTNLGTKLDTAEDAFKCIYVPKHTNYEFQDEQAAEKFLDDNGFQEFTYKNFLAKLLIGEHFSVEENCQLTSPQEILALNQILKKFVSKHRAYSLGKHLYQLDQVFSSNQAVITSTKMLEIITNMNGMKALTPLEVQNLFSECLGYDKYIPKETYSTFIASLPEKGLFLENGKTELTETDKKVLMDLVASYLSPTCSPILQTIDIMHGKKFAELLIAKHVISSYQETPITEERASQFIANYFPTLPKALSSNLTMILVDKKFTLTNYAHFSSLTEMEQFNQIALNLLEILAAQKIKSIESEIETEKFCILWRSLQSEAQERALLGQIEAINLTISTLKAKYNSPVSQESTTSLILADDLNQALATIQTPIIAPITATPSPIQPTTHQSALHSVFRPWA